MLSTRQEMSQILSVGENLPPTTKAVERNNQRFLILNRLPQTKTSNVRLVTTHNTQQYNYFLLSYKFVRTHTYTHTYIQ
jgi:hypothetical protein